MFSQLDQFERTDLIQVALPWIQRLGPQKRRAILRDIVRAFKAWKMARADVAGSVEIFEPTTLGLLGQAGLPGAPKSRRVAAATAKPWQCAGQGVSDNIGLAFHLWLSKPNPFHDVLSRHGIAEVFATLTYWLHASARSRSLIRASGFLASCAHNEVNGWRIVAERAYERLSKRQAQLEKARAKSRATRPQYARLRHERARQLAIDYRREHPSAQTPEVIAYLKQFDDFKAWKKSDRSFLLAIQGTRGAALKSLDTKPRS
jgi:hypothetical protein